MENLTYNKAIVRGTKYERSQYEMLRRKKNIQIENLKREKEEMQVSINKSIKMFFDFLDAKGIKGSEFVEYARRTN